MSDIIATPDGYRFSRMYRAENGYQNLDLSHFIEHVRKMPYIQVDLKNNMPTDCISVGEINPEYVGMKITQLDIRTGDSWTQLCLTAVPYGFQAPRAIELIERLQTTLGFASQVGEFDGKRYHRFYTLWLFDHGPATQTIQVI